MYDLGVTILWAGGWLIFCSTPLIAAKISVERDKKRGGRNVTSR